ncbi:MAG: hypothetical protein ABR542_08260, partial [Desulfonatronovibrio sp.]
MAMAYVHELEHKITDAYLEVLTQAYSNDFPIRPLLLKIQEGLGKNVSHQIILKTVQQIRYRFDRLAVILEEIPPGQSLDSKSLLNRMNSLTAMGVAEDEIRDRLKNHSDYMNVINALEVRQALVNAGMSKEDAQNLTDAGLENNYFTSPGWGMTRIARSALEKGVSDSKVKQSMLGLVRGEMKEQEAAARLGVDKRSTEGYGKSGSITGRSRNQTGNERPGQKPGHRPGSTVTDKS